MSCTIFYKGKLKEDKTVADVLNILSGHLNGLNAELTHRDNPLIIRFLHGKSESLVFEFEKNAVDGFFKWNGESPEEFYKIYDMFIELKPLFKSLKIDDDEGIWHEYYNQKQPCKISLRPLKPEEKKLLERIENNMTNPVNEIEQFIMMKSRLKPYYKNLLRIIAQDFIKTMGIYSMEDFDPQSILNLTNKLKFAGKYYVEREMDSFSFDFYQILLEIWISYLFEFKGISRASELLEDVKGFNSSKIAALCGIASIFLNRHGGGAANSKESEMRKFAKKHYNTGLFAEVMVIDKPERELEMLFSMMDYLGFRYVGI